MIQKQQPNHLILAMLLNQYQERERHGIQVLKVSQALNSPDIRRWMRQLCLAATALERIGLIHRDIRPGNKHAFGRGPEFEIERFWSRDEDWGGRRGANWAI